MLRASHVIGVVALLAVGCASEPAGAPAAPPRRKRAYPESTLRRSTRRSRAQDDLFRHVNGGWLAKTEIPADKSSWGSFDMLVDKSQADLRAIVEEAAKATSKAPGSDPQKIGDFYESFMNEARIEELGIEAARKRARRDRSPVDEDRPRALLRADVQAQSDQPARRIRRRRRPGADTRNPLRHPGRPRTAGSRLLLQGRCEAQGLPREVPRLSHRAADAGASRARPTRPPRRIFALETRLARAHWTNVESRDAVKTYNKRTLADLPKEFPGFDWAAWIAELGISQAPAIVIAQPSYVKAFAALVNEAAGRSWKPYLRASLMNGFAPYLSKPLVDAEFGFYGKTLRGVTENEPRWKRAVNTINGNLGEMLGKLYVERHFTPEAKARMEQLVENLRARVPRRHRRARVDEPGDEEAGAGEAREVPSEDRLPEQVARLLARAASRTTTWSAM